MHAFAPRHGQGTAVIQVGRLEGLPDVFHRHVAGVHHVAGVEAVIPQVVHHDFKCGEIVAPLAVARDDLVDGDTQRGLAQRVGVQSVGDVADGAHGENHLQPGVEGVQGVEHQVELLHHVGHGSHAAFKLVLRHLVAVGHHLASGLEPIDDSGAQGDGEQLGALQGLVALLDGGTHAVDGRLLVGQAVARVEVITVPHATLHEQVTPGDGLTVDEALHAACDTHRVVERPHRVNGGIHEGATHLGADVVAEARAQQHHAVVVVQPTAVLACFHCRPELHGHLKWLF